MRTFPAIGPVSVDVDLGIGSVQILASDRDDATVDIRPRDEDNPADLKAVTQARVDYVAGALTVRAEKTWRRYTPINDGTVDVTFEVPSGSNVTGRTDLGELSAGGRLGDVRFKSAMGRVRLEEAHKVDVHTSFGEVVIERCTGAAEITSSSGRIRIGSLRGASYVKNSNGDTWIGEASGSLHVKAANGDITVDHALASLTAKSANGSLRIGEVVAGKVELHTSAGDVEIGVRAGSAAWLDVGSKYGQVRNALTSGEPPQPGAPVVEIRASTPYGDVVIDRVPVREELS